LSSGNEHLSSAQAEDIAGPWPEKTLKGFFSIPVSIPMCRVI